MDENILLVQENKENSEVKNFNLKGLKFNKVFDFSIFIACCIFSIVLIIMFFTAANSIKTGGLEIMSIESVGGKTLEEAYYQNLGYVYEGYCVAIRAIGVFCSSLFLFFGVSRLKNAR